MVLGLIGSYRIEVSRKAMLVRWWGMNILLFAEHAIVPTIVVRSLHRLKTLLRLPLQARLQLLSFHKMTFNGTVMIWFLHIIGIVPGTLFIVVPVGRPLFPFNFSHIYLHILLLYFSIVFSSQSCDATTLSPWNYDKYRSPSGYGPQDPNDFGGPSVYGEKLWVTAAIMNIDQGSDDGCCGSTSEGGGCGNCILIQNPDSLHPEWSVMAMKKVCSVSFRFISKRSTSFVLSYYCSK